MADNVQLICWSTLDRLGIGIQIRTLANQFHSQNEELVQIDTGYSEELLIPQELFETLNLARWHYLTPLRLTARQSPDKLSNSMRRR